MRQDSHHLRLLALLYERVVQHYALVLEEAIPACAYLCASYQQRACNDITVTTVVNRPSTVTMCTGVCPARCCQSCFDGKGSRGLSSRRPFHSRQGMSRRSSHVCVAVCRASGAVDDEQLGERKFERPCQLLNLLPAHGHSRCHGLSSAHSSQSSLQSPPSCRI